MNETRPVNLNLTTIYFPITAIVSILHRISGVALIVFLPFLLSALHCSLQNQKHFSALITLFQHPLMKCFLFVFLLNLIYHIFAGARHLIMDCGIGESLTIARTTAKVTLGLSLFVSLLAGIWLW